MALRYTQEGAPFCRALFRLKPRLIHLAPLAPAHQLVHHHMHRASLIEGLVGGAADGHLHTGPLRQLTGALGGVMYAAFSGASTPTLGWPDMHMLVIAGVVLGGTKLTGGVGNIWYTLGGVMLLGVVDNIMNLLNVQTYVNTLITGLIMIGILYLDKVMMTKKTKKANLE